MGLSARPASIVLRRDESQESSRIHSPKRGPLGTVISFQVRQGRNCNEQISEQHGHRLLGDPVTRRQIVVAGRSGIPCRRCPEFPRRCGRQRLDQRCQVRQVKSSLGHSLPSHSLIRSRRSLARLSRCGDHAGRRTRSIAMSFSRNTLFRDGS
jgi:hypothetical protein